MTKRDAEQCIGKVRVITVNSTWRLAPWADAHYSSDPEWWGQELPEMRAWCAGEFWTGHPAGIAQDVKVCPYDRKLRGLSRVPGRIAWGGNSGYCAIGLAVQFGATRIVLLGYDQRGETHWHDDHPEGVRRPFNFSMWHERFAELAADAARMEIEVVNCSRETALTCFPRISLDEALC